VNSNILEEHTATIVTVQMIRARIQSGYTLKLHSRWSLRTVGGEEEVQSRRTEAGELQENKPFSGSRQTGK
jgi:hypothetical protein